MNTDQIPETLIVQPGVSLANGVVFRLFEDGAHIFAETNNLFKDKRSIVFMGPAPFSRLDTQQAIEYEQLSSELLKHVDVIYGIYIQDAFVMREFEKYVSQQAGSNNVQFWGDGDGTFSRMNKILHDFTDTGLGVRTGRWCFVLNTDSIVEYVACDDFSEINITGAKELLKALEEDEN